MTAAAIEMNAYAREEGVGRWAVDQQFCRGAGDTHRSAPLIVSATTLTWASEFCMVGKMYTRKNIEGFYFNLKMYSGTTTFYDIRKK